MLAKNSMEGQAEEHLKRIETLLVELDTERGVYMQRCKEVRDDIRQIYIEAKDKGVPTKALKGLVKRRQLSRKQAAIVEGLDTDEASAYTQLVEALGDLGAAAAKAAGYL